MNDKGISQSHRHRARVLILAAIGGIALLSVSLPALAGSRPQDGSASSSDRIRPVIAREITLDTKVNAVLHLSFLISRPLVDGQTKENCRVASVLGFTDVNGQIQYDLAHASPAVPGRGRDPIEFVIGFDQEGTSGDFRVRLEPQVRKTWNDVIDVEDLAVSTTKL